MLITYYSPGRWAFSLRAVLLASARHLRYSGDMTGRLGYTNSVIKRKDLKAKRELSDEALLRDAQRQAEKWQAQLRKQRGN